MTMKKRDLLLIPAAALGVMIANVAISFGIVWVYATFLDPGQPFARYEAFAATAAPISSVVAGIPLMLAAGYVLAKGRSRRGALLAAGAAALLYILLDLAILLGMHAGGSVWGWEALSHATKLMSALAGAALRPVRTPGMPIGG
jgi:SNF family Na+-dependent transporter